MQAKGMIEQKLDLVIIELETFKLRSDPQLEGYLLGQKSAFMDVLRILAPNEYGQVH